MKKLFAIVLCLAMCFGLLAVTASAEGDTYLVAGAEGLCGTSWATDTNFMQADSNGIYSITFENIAAGTYEYKVVKKNGDNLEWFGDPNNGYENYRVSLSTTDNVTISYNPSTGEVRVSGSGLGDAPAPEIVDMCLVGEGLDGLDWSPENRSVKMTKTAEGIYEHTFTAVQSEWVKLKMAANGTWDVYNIGGSYEASDTVTNAVMGGSSPNIEFAVPETSDVHVKLDLTGLNYTAGTGAKFTITITPVTAEEPEPAPDPEAEKITVYAQVPSDWTAAYVYAWDASGTYITTWPGDAMELGDDGWYTFEIDAWAENVIINNGNGGQTQDMAIEKENTDLWIVVSAVDGGFSGEIEYESPKTGDAANLAALSAALILAAAGIVTTVASRQKFI